MAEKNLSHLDPDLPDGSGYRLGIAVSAYNAHITDKLYEECVALLQRQGASYETSQVPGSFELPTAALWLAETYNPDAVICLGCVIKGDTRHDEYINRAVAEGLMDLSLRFAKPFVFGVLTTESEQQALDRAGGKRGNKGVESAVTALRMIELYRGLQTGRKKTGFQR